MPQRGAGHQPQITQSHHNSNTVDRQDRTGSLEPRSSTRPQDQHMLPPQDLLPLVPSRIGERWPSYGHRIRHWRRRPQAVWPLGQEGRPGKAPTSPLLEIRRRSSMNANSFDLFKAQTCSKYRDLLSNVLRSDREHLYYSLNLKTFPLPIMHLV